jgi:hypothetical protein
MSLRYVILRHEGIEHPHYDLMLETSPGSPALATWRLPEWPIAARAGVTRLADHRRDYLEYEGPVSENHGTVRRVVQGEWESRGSPDAACWDLVLLTPAPPVCIILEQDRGDSWQVRVRS